MILNDTKFNNEDMSMFARPESVVIKHNFAIKFNTTRVDQKVELWTQDKVYIYSVIDATLNLEYTSKCARSELVARKTSKHERWMLNRWDYVDDDEKESSKLHRKTHH